MPRRRLDVEAARVEADALADQRHLRRVFGAPCHVDQARRGDRGAADGVDHREILLEQIVALDHRDLGLVRRGQGPHRLLQFVRPHVAGRRVDQIARQENAIGDVADARRIGAGRQREAQPLAGLLAIAGKDIAAERQRDGREFRLGRGRGEIPVAFRQGSRQRADGKRAVAIADTEQRAGERAVFTRHDQCPARLAGKAVGRGPGDRRHA